MPVFKNWKILLTWAGRSDILERPR